MSATGSVPRGRRGLERRGWWAAAGVLGVVLLLWLVPAIVNDAMADEAVSPVDANATYRLVSDDGAKATVRPDASWSARAQKSGPNLVFHTDGTVIVAQIFADVDAIDRFWDRQARVSQAASPPEWAQRQGDYTTATGMTGPTGTITGSQTEGERYLLASSRKPHTILAFDIIGPPGALDDPAPQFDRFLDSAKVTS